MKITLIKINSATIPSSNQLNWVARDENNHSGVGRTQEEAIGDIVLSYQMLVKKDEKTFELEINQP